MDCDVAAVFDHVSHLSIVEAVESMNVLGTFVQLDDIMTAGVRRTCSAPQGDPCAADLFGAALDVLAEAFLEICHSKKW